MSRNRRSGEESVKKKAKINKSSSKDNFEKVASDARAQVSSAAAASVPPSKVSVPSLKASAPASKASILPSKDSSVQSTSVKPTISIKALVVYNLMDMVTNQKGGGQGSSKTSSVGKGVPPKNSIAPTKDISSSSAEAGKSTIPEKAKIQDKNVATAAAVPDSFGLKAKIQDKTPDEGVKTSGEAQIQDKDVGEAPVSGCLSSRDMSKLRQIAANLRPLSDRSGVQLPPEPQILVRDIVSPSRGGERFLHSIFETMQEEFLPFDVAFDSAEVAEGSSLACDEIPANTFVMSAQAVEPFVTAANRICLPQVEEELILQGGHTLYKSLLSSQVKSLAITHASLRQYKELSRMKADRDVLRKDLSALETKVKEKEEALALSNKRLADLSSEKEALSQSAKDFELKVTSLDKQVEELDASLAKARNINDDLRGKVDAATLELTAFSEAEKLRLSAICGQIRDALVSVGTFLNNVVHLAVRDLFRSLEAGGSDALVKAVSDSFSFVSTDTTPPSLVDALMKFGGHIDESFWSRVLSIGRQPQDEDSSDFPLSEFATPKPLADASLGKCVTPESSSEISLSEFATPEPSSRGLARHEPPIEIFSSPSEIYLSSDSDPLSPVEGGTDSFTVPPGSLDVVAAEDEGLVDAIYKVALLLVGAPLEGSMVVEAIVTLLFM
ncbi:hypothetical protein EJB05_08570, partial [Eragrostis curvula]